jgi:hypothetical protein
MKTSLIGTRNTRPTRTPVRGDALTEHSSAGKRIVKVSAKTGAKAYRIVVKKKRRVTSKGFVFYAAQGAKRLADGALPDASTGERKGLFRWDDLAPAAAETTGTPEYSVAEWIARISDHRKLRYAQRLGKRLQTLYAIAQEEQPEQAPPSLASLKSLTAFLVRHSELAWPQIVLSPEGHLTAQWREGRGKLLSLRFVDDEDVQFVIFAPDPRRPYKTARVSGRASVDSVMALAMPYGVLAWAGEKIEDKVDA